MGIDGGSPYDRNDISPYRKTDIVKNGGRHNMADTSEQDQIILARLQALGFSDKTVETPKRLIASIAGQPKTGKTHVALTAPEPILFFNIDIGTEGVVGKFQEGFDGHAPKRVFMYDVRVPTGAAQADYTPMWNDLKQRLEIAFKMKQGTVIIDTSSEAYELARLSHFGKLTQIMPHQYTEVNSEWRELMRKAYDSSINTIFIHKQKPRYINNTRTSEYDLAGFSEMGYLSQINIVTHRFDIEDEAPEFSIEVVDCRHKPSLNGQIFSGPMCDFNFLLGVVHSK